MMFKRLSIVSPKRNKRLQTGWEGFFPYYAGYPEVFARELLRSAKLSRGAVVLDPWNGSGTTTYTATTLGLNPVMIIVARARLLPPSEADHLRPLAATILSHAHSTPPAMAPDDALLGWFDPATAAFVRGIEQNIRRSLVGSMTKSPDGVHLDRISGTAATLYVALFAACRRLVAPFRCQIALECGPVFARNDDPFDDVLSRSGIGAAEPVGGAQPRRSRVGVRRDV